MNGTNEGITRQYRIRVTGHSSEETSGSIMIAPPGEPPPNPPLFPGDPRGLTHDEVWPAMLGGLLDAGYEAVLEQVDVAVSELGPS